MSNVQKLRKTYITQLRKTLIELEQNKINIVEINKKIELLNKKEFLYESELFIYSPAILTIINITDKEKTQFLTINKIDNILKYFNNKQINLIFNDENIEITDKEKLKQYQDFKIHKIINDYTYELKKDNIHIKFIFEKINKPELDVFAVDYKKIDNNKKLFQYKLISLETSYFNKNIEPKKKEYLDKLDYYNIEQKDIEQNKENTNFEETNIIIQVDQF